MRIAVLDDDAVHIDLVKGTLETIGHACIGFTKAKDLLDCFKQEDFDLLVVDWQMPELNGPDVVQWLRTNIARHVPVVMLTVRSEERDLVHALACGADDFLSKPIRPKELAARVRALLRRAYPGEMAQECTRGPYRLDRRSSTATVGGKPIPLKHREFELAWRLFANEGQLLTRHSLIHSIWGPTVSVSSRCLDTCVWSVRSKMDLRPAKGFRLTAVYGVGYRLEFLEVGSESPQWAPAEDDSPSNATASC